MLGTEYRQPTHSHKEAGSTPALDSQLSLWAKQSNPYGAQLDFWGVGWFFYYVHWPFKAGGKHAGNLEAFELGGAEYFTMAQPNSFPKPQEKAGRLMETFCIWNPNKGKTVLKVMLSPCRDASVPYHTHLFKNKLNQTDLGIAARRVCVLWPLQAPACWIHRSLFYFIPGKQRKDVLPNALCS